jgi:hypothetical protein
VTDHTPASLKTTVTLWLRLLRRADITGRMEELAAHDEAERSRLLTRMMEFFSSRPRRHRWTLLLYHTPAELMKSEYDVVQVQKFITRHRRRPSTLQVAWGASRHPSTLQRRLLAVEPPLFPTNMAS